MKRDFNRNNVTKLDKTYRSDEMYDWNKADQSQTGKNFTDPDEAEQILS